MPHVTFIHGIGNKPEREQLRQIWLRSLAAAGGLDLGAEGVTSAMVYWADVLHAEPDPNVAAYEAAALDEHGVEADPAADVPTADSADEALFLAGIAAKLGGTLAAAELAAEPQARGTDLALERIPLPSRIFCGTFTIICSMPIPAPGPANITRFGTRFGRVSSGR